MLDYQHLELLSAGPVSTVRLLNQRPFRADKVVELTAEWNSVADRADCHALVVDCSNVRLLSSEILSKLLLLQRRLKRRQATLVLTGLRHEVREVMNWTRLDRCFEIDEDAEVEMAASA